MKLLRYKKEGVARPGWLDAAGVIHDLSSRVGDLEGQFLEPLELQKLSRENLKDLPLVKEAVDLLPCVSGVGKVVGVALNYRLHAEETGGKVPSEPVLFLKATSALCGPYDRLILPPQSVKTDWEVELGVVVGRRARQIRVDEALEYVAGYCVLDDVSERAFQLERGGQQHTKGKSADTFCPLGPWLVTQDEIKDPQNLRLWTKVNGMLMQNGTTADMLFSVSQLLSYVSEFMTLLPGDVIATGTPDGVGKGFNPPRYLKTGDIVELGIDGLGVQKHQVISYEESLRL